MNRQGRNDAGWAVEAVDRGHAGECQEHGSMITMEYKVEFTKKPRNGRVKKGGGECDSDPSDPSVHKISRLMALAIKMDRLVREECYTYSDLAKMGKVSRSRISQIMSLLNLAPDIQEEMLFLNPKDARRAHVAAPRMRKIAGKIDWERQRGIWAKVARAGAGEDPCPMPSVVSAVAGPSLQRSNV